MKHRICPNCGNTSPDAASGCSCGFLWNEGVEVPAPDIVRVRGGQRSVVEQMGEDDEDDPAPTDSDSPVPEAHPLLSSDGMRRRATAPASFGSNSPAKPRQQTAPPREASPSSEDEVFLGMKEEAMVVLDNLTTKNTTAAPNAQGKAARPNSAMLMECPACDARISRRATRCPKCNTAPYQPCQICASPIMVNSESCGECGDPDPFDAAGMGQQRA